MSVSFENGDAKSLKSYFNPRLIKRGIVLFIGISLVGLIAIFLYTNTGKTLEVWKTISWSYLLLGLLLVVNDLFLGGLRNHIFIREFKKGISLWVSIKANLANIFIGAVTPTQSGGGPAQFYIFYRNGISLIDSFSNSFYNYISTMIFFPLSGAVALFILQNNIPSGLVLHLTKFGFTVFITILIVISVGLVSPGLIGKLIKAIGNVLSSFKPNSGERLIQFGLTAEIKMLDYRQRFISLIRTKPQLMLYSFLLTVVLYFNKYLVAYIILLAFGLETDFWTVIAIQAVVYLLLYFAPSPGGSGIAELSISGLMSGIISQDYLASFTLLFRGFLVFIPAIIGSLVVLRQIASDGLNEKAHFNSTSQPS